MNDIFTVRDHLLDELELAVRTSGTLMKRIEADQWDFRPADNMRTLRQLAEHLASVPASDLAILRELPEQEVGAVEAAVGGLSGKELAERMHGNYEAFRKYMQSLTEEELLRQSTKAFYLDHGTVQIKWLIETTTHAFHHRAQLYNYLKQLGHELHFVMLYGG